MTFRTIELLTIVAALALLGCNREAAAPNGATPSTTPATPATATASASSAPSSASAPWTPKIQPLMLAAASGSSEPELTVSDKSVLVSWVENEDKSSLKYAERTATGWADPKIAASGTDWFINDSDVPSVLRLSNGTLAASWLQTTNDELEAYNLRLAYSKDDGKTWSKSFMPHHDGTVTEHGFASLFELSDHGLGVIWLDGRQMVKDRDHGPMSIRYASYDPQWKQTTDAAIDAKVCECCSTSAAMTTDGPIAVYRDRTDAEIRDIYATRFENGKWTDGRPVHNDNWHIDACPVNGPSVSANGRDVVVGWFTTKDNVGQAYVAFSQDGGRTFGDPIRLDDASTLGRVSVSMLEDGSAAATWVEFADKRGQFGIRHIERSGKKSPAVVIAGASGGRVSGVPRFARLGNQLVFAWSETPANGGPPSVKTATAQLPH